MCYPTGMERAIHMRLEPLREQIIVITGASSGIGFTTAMLAARRGAHIVLAARNEEALGRIVDTIQQQGGRFGYVVADVGVA